jgi:alanine racemase
VDTTGLSTWIEICAAALRHNLELFRSRISPSAGLLAVVKANAYGHGLETVARLCEGERVAMLGVHAAAEISALRAAGVRTPVLAMGYLTAAQVEAVVDPDVHVLLSSREVLAALVAHASRLGRRLPVHIKVDTGTHRQGVPPGEAAQFARAACDAGLEVVGVATHFANIEDTTDHGYAYSQLERFRAAAAAIQEAVGPVPYLHAACSAAALLFREADFSLVRVGISLYGHWPSRETYLSWLQAHGRDGVRLEPALAWRCRVGQLKEVGRGEPIGYGLTYRPTRPTLVAVLPVGYAEGYPRGLSNRGRVLLHGQTARVLGRVCMNHVMVDVTDIGSVAEGDVATLIGRDGGERVSAEELGELTGTINYEILARLSPLLSRILV